jgi:hypothetical protein
MSITPYTNDVGEILGWDTHYDDAPDPDEWYEQHALESDNPCDYCGEEIGSAKDEVRIRIESGIWKGRHDYVHSKCAEESVRPGTHLASDGTIIRIVEEVN